MKNLAASTETTKGQVLMAALRFADCWPDDLSKYKGNTGLLVKLLRACKRYRSATGKAFLKRHGIKHGS